MKTLRYALALAASFAGCAAPVALTAQETEPAQNAAGEGLVYASYEGELPGGAAWRFDVPAQWNGTVVLVSHGYNGGPANPAVNSMGGSLALQRDLLARGIALIGSSYSSTGWAVKEALEDQVAALDLFAARFGQPRRVIAYGESMGGLVSLGLIERNPGRFAGALPVCSSAAGAVPMMNAGFDGMFALRTLVAPGLPIVGITDEQAAARQLRTTLDEAQQTPEGRARIALAASLAQLTTWAIPGSPRPAADDWEAQQRQLFAMFAPSVALPRGDQEKRAGGNFSGNVGVDYAALLDRSGGRALVEALYREAGLDLGADLDRLAAAERVAPDPAAEQYMLDNFTPSGKLTVPVLLLHNVADGVTQATLTSGFLHRAQEAGSEEMVRRLFVDRSGHCEFRDAELRIALDALLARIDSGQWPALDAATLNAKGTGRSPAQFTDEVPGPMTRP